MTTSINSLLANNISVDNGLNSVRTSGDIRVDSGAVPTTTLNNDRPVYRLGRRQVHELGGLLPATVV